MKLSIVPKMYRPFLPEYLNLTLSTMLFCSIKYILIQLQEPINSKTTVYKECIKKGIEPIVSDVLQYRIKKYLEISNKKIDYELVNVS